MIIKTNFFLFILTLFISCKDTGIEAVKLEAKVEVLDSLSFSKNLNKGVDTTVAIIPKYPRIDKGYKFLGVKDSIHYVLILNRIDNTTVEFQADNDHNNSPMYYGTASLNKEEGVNIEKSKLNGNSYKSFEFIESNDSTEFIIRIGIDSIGSGDRLLVRFMEKNKGNLITDLNLAN